MKKINKTKRNLLVLIMCLFVFSGCTSNFCNSTDKANMREYYIEQNYDKWEEEAIIKYEIVDSDGRSTEEQEKIDKYMKDKANAKIKGVESCITLKDYETNEGYTISGKSWKDAWKKGFIEGLLVYPISAGLIFLTDLIGPSGVGQFFALLIITILIKLLTLLATFKSQKQSQVMQTIQPQMQELQLKMQNAQSVAEQQKYQQQMLKIYQDYKINPLSMLITPFITMPVFIAVWGAIKGTAVISDGTLFGLSFSVKLSNQLFSGNIFAIIIFILMVAAQICSMMLPQWLRKSKNPRDDKKKNPMNGYMIFMLVLMLWTGLFLPSGMAIYWTMSAVFSAAQTTLFQLLGRKKGDKKKYEKVYR